MNPAKARVLIGAGATEESNAMEQTMRSRFNAQDLLPELGEISAALFKVTGNGSVPPITIGLIGLRACQITGNTYALVRQARELRKLGESEDRIDALASWWDAPYFTDAERVALALTEAVLRPTTAWEEKVPDDLYARAAEHYDAKALITLTVAIGQAMFFMPVALIGRPLPGMPPAETWT
jgi:alkylhydroperoxidase family enzyme